MDASVVSLSHDLYLVSTTDFFYPLVDCAYQQGQIACANVLSDLYAMGLVTVDSMLMILSTSTEMKMEDVDRVTPLLIKGFHDTALVAGTNVTGGQTVQNPWVMIGGVAMKVCREIEMIRPTGTVNGDVLLLTKALGTQVAVNLYEWKRKNNALWKSIQHLITPASVDEMYEKAIAGMIRLNKTAALLMHKYGAHAATDVTGFGFLGHLKNLVECQTKTVDFRIHTFPVLPHMVEIDEACNSMFQLKTGFSAETSGGLVISLPADAAPGFLKEIYELDGETAWIIGEVIDGDRVVQYNAASLQIVHP